MLSFKKNQRTKVIGLSAIVLTLIAAVPQAQAFNLLQFASDTFGVGDLYTSASGLFASNSNLYQTIQGLAGNIGGAVDGIQGSLGIADPNKLYEKGVGAYAQKPVDVTNPRNVDLQAERTKALVAGTTGSAPLTIEGQKKSAEEAQQQANLSAAANQSMQDTQGSTSTLEALQNGIGATNALSQQFKGFSTQLIQTNQTIAAGVTIQQQMGRELATSNNIKQLEKQDEASILTHSAQVPMPLFHVHE
jgi:hypothetical protein